jgi:polar amino acid transport system substrate-binding protein
MRKRITLGAAAAAALAALAATVAGSSSAARPAAVAAPLASCSPATLSLVNTGQLTIGTDNPAYPPWYAGGTLKGSPWKINDPSTGKGYESAVAYAVAKQLGFSKSQVKWTYIPFNKAFAPGKKSFDFDINQISYTPARAKVVAFSVSYYDVNQAIVVNKGTKIAAIRSVKGLRSFKLGAQLGTTSYGFIKDRIKPSQQPAVYPSNAGAVLALKNKQIDGLVVDLPTAFYVTAVQVPNSKILGQFENAKGASTDRFGVVLAKGNSLTACVNKAITTLRKNGTLDRLRRLWLAKATGAPILK